MKDIIIKRPKSEARVAINRTFWLSNYRIRERPTRNVELSSGPQRRYQARMCEGVVSDRDEPEVVQRNTFLHEILMDW